MNAKVDGLPAVTVTTVALAAVGAAFAELANMKHASSPTARAAGVRIHFISRLNLPIGLPSGNVAEPGSSSLERTLSRVGADRAGVRETGMIEGL